MSRFKPYHGYALFIVYREDEKDCRAEIYCNAALLDVSEWVKTEEEAFGQCQVIIDGWMKQQEKEKSK